MLRYAVISCVYIHKSLHLVYSTARTCARENTIILEERIHHLKNANFARKFATHTRKKAQFLTM